MAIKTIAKDETATRETTTEGKIVKCVRTVSPNAGSPVRFVVQWAYDFTDVKPEEIMELAASGLVIRTQGTWRKVPQKERESDAWGNRTIKVRELLDSKASRGPVDPAQAVKKNFAKLSDAEKAELLKSLQDK